MKIFAVTSDHIALLRAAYVDWEDCEYGAPAIDCKRPYGNSSVEYDIAKILGWSLEGNDGYEACLSSAQRERASVIHRETQHALQIFLATGEMTPGTYCRGESYNSRRWTRVVASPTSSSPRAP